MVGIDERKTGHGRMAAGGYVGIQDSVLILVCWQLSITKVKEKNVLTEYIFSKLRTNFPKVEKQQAVVN